MKFVVLDYETHFDSKTFTLSKMTTESYIRDPRFQAHGAAIKFSPDLPARWWNRHELPQLFKEIDWSDVFLIAHHNQFDGLILSHHYGVIPKMYGCTLAMARLLIGNHLSVSLDNVRKHFGMPSKKTPYHLFDGKHWDEIIPAHQQQIGEGACDEVESIWNLFKHFMQIGFPTEELEVVDEIIKMFAQPVLRADVQLLGEIWSKEDVRKKELQAQLNVTEADLQSSDRFAQLLRDEGEEPETKEGKNGPIYAFAKTDPYIRDYLLEHENERVRTLAEARLGVKSTLMQTRAETLGWMASRGSLCVYLSYAGAGTLRVSGGDGANWLNFKRGSAIRKSVQAPEGYILAPADSSQIECRVLHYLAGGADEPVIQKFRNNEDPYVDLASRFYGEQIYKPKQGDPRAAEMEAKRGMGKQGRLMCLGPDTIVLTDQGLHPITEVLPNMRLWDGTEWVNHSGLISNGVQNVVNIKDVWLTPDHPVLCGNLWEEALNLQNENTLSQALESGSANLPFQDTNLELKAAFCSSWSGAPAERQNIRYIRPIFTKVQQHVAMRAPKKLPVTGLKNTTDTPSYVLTMGTGADFSAALAQFLHVVTSKVLEIITPMAVAEYAYTNRGDAAASVFWPISSNSQDGMIPRWNWIDATTIADMCRGICDSLPNKRISKIADPSKILQKKMPVYDLAFSGPRNRFTIVTCVGPIIVHNCGYGAAGPKFKVTAKNGLYGPPCEISLEDANHFVGMYREDNPSICMKGTGYWAQASRMLSRLAGGDPAQWGPLTVRDHRIYLPNGCPLIYDTLHYHIPSDEEKAKLREHEHAGYWRVRTRSGWKTMWGSKLVQNICEAVSRVIISQALIRLRHLGYRALNWPYDELLLLVPKDGQLEHHLQIIHAEMVREVPWLPGLPLGCEITPGERYSK